MNAYVDSSVLLRVILGQPGKLPQWRTIRRPVASVLVGVECLRTLDRLCPTTGISDRDLVVRRETVYNLMEEMETVELNTPILNRASQPLPAPLGTLDALHLATALEWRDRTSEDLIMATHDEALALAARSFGFRVLGVQS